MSLCQVQIIGNLGGDPEMRYMNNGDPVTSFSVAANYKFGEKEETDWFRVSVFGRQAEACQQYLAKGRKVYVQGRFHMEEYTDRNGIQRTSCKVNATQVVFLESLQSTGATPVAMPHPGAIPVAGAPVGAPTEEPAGDVLSPDDLPF